MWWRGGAFRCTAACWRRGASTFGLLQVGDAGRGLQGGVLRGRECLSVPVAAAVPLRGRAPGVGRAGTGAGTGTGAGSEGRVGRDGEPAGARVLGARARAARAKGAKGARTAMGARRGRGRGGAGELSAGAAAGGGPVPGEGGYTSTVWRSLGGRSRWRRRYSS